MIRIPFPYSLLVVIAVSLAGCNAVTSATAASDPPASGSTAKELALYRSVLDKVHADYVDPVSDSTLIDNSLKGMLSRLDPHSNFMNEREYQEMLDDSAGEFAGIGAELTQAHGHPTVLSPIDGTPAARAGIKPGDAILRINGRITNGMSLRDVVDLLRGPVGSKVELTIGRKDVQPFVVTLIRAIIHVASVKSALEPDDVGYIRISSFAETTQHEVTRAIAHLKAETHGQVKGLVLDLRNNPGGLLDQAVDVAGDFLDGGTTVSIRGRSPDDNRVFPAPWDGNRLHGVPMVVLINGASASAAEIVAGALQDRHRAEIYGTQSFGKGSVQTIIPLDGHGALRLTTARYYTPSGRSIQGRGITPDRVVKEPKGPDSTSVELVREADLPGALDVGPKAKTAAARVAIPPVKDENLIDATAIGTSKDYQLQVALGALDKRFQVGTAATR